MTSAALLEVTPPPGRKAVFLGDLVDRGPKTVDVLRLVLGDGRQRGLRCAVPGNHDVKLLVRHLSWPGNVQYRRTGWPRRSSQLARRGRGVPPGRRGLPRRPGLATCVLDDGRLVVAHAGLAERMQGRASARVRSFCLYGQTTGETDDYGLPVRYPWAEDYRGRATVLYGHTPVPAAEWVNNTMCLDTGCVFGGRLTALRLSRERSSSRSPRRGSGYEPARPFRASAGSARPPAIPRGATPECSTSPTSLGKRVIETGYHGAGHGPRGERGRRARGDEPVRGRSALAALPAADHGPAAHVRPAGPAGAPGRGVRGVPGRRASPT